LIGAGPALGPCTSGAPPSTSGGDPPPPEALLLATSSARRPTGWRRPLTAAGSSALGASAGQHTRRPADLNSADLAGKGWRRLRTGGAESKHAAGALQRARLDCIDYWRAPASLHVETKNRARTDAQEGCPRPADQQLARRASTRQCVGSPNHHSHSHVGDDGDDRGRRPGGRFGGINLVQIPLAALERRRVGRSRYDLRPSGQPSCSWVAASPPRAARRLIEDSRAILIDARARKWAASAELTCGRCLPLVSEWPSKSNVCSISFVVC
jgi:hypothetical protein